MTGTGSILQTTADIGRVGVDSMLRGDYMYRKDLLHHLISPGLQHTAISRTRCLTSDLVVD